MHRLLLAAIATATALALLAAAATGATASSLIGISNGAPPWGVTAGPGTLSFTPSAGTPFSCTARLAGTLPTATLVEPLGAPVLPIGSIDGADVFACPVGYDVFAGAPWGISLNRVLWNGPDLIGIRIGLLDVEVMALLPGSRCHYSGGLGGLYDETTGLLDVSGSLALTAGGCAGTSLSVSGTFSLFPLVTLLP